MKPFIKFAVAPTVPKDIKKLQEIAYNFWWTWDRSAEDLFIFMDEELWEEVNHNPILMMSRLRQEQMDLLATNKDFIRSLDKVYASFQSYLNDTTWYSTVDKHKGTIAYFCAEFGLSEGFMNYSGGLGVLAGDHLKSASDLGVPLVGVGLLYQQGYFHQYLTQNGWQSEQYTDMDFTLMPVTLVKNEANAPVLIDVDLPLGKAYAQIWRVNVGRIALYLLDTNISANDANPEYRSITDQLYGGTTETRIMQEIVLGIGGMRALRAMNIEPHVIHINEGHAAFSALERTRMYMQKYSMDFHQAATLTSSGACFTTHTPVPAGNEIFTLDIMRKYFTSYFPLLKLTEEEFFDLAREKDASIDEGFSMTVLGLRMSTFRNGVSQLHGHVAQRMWRHIWQQSPLEEIPIQGITNGIHTMTWVARELSELYDRYLTPRWRTETDDPSIWKKVETIPNSEFWQIHNRRREKLVLYTRNHLRRKKHEHVSADVHAKISDCLNPDVFTIGFARRFATYKRSNLLFKDMDRLAALLNNPERPVQIVIAGKAHPRDMAGKEIMQSIVTKIQSYNLENKIVFLEDYDMGVARFMVKGADIWLNNPRRPYEASGTSGMKAALNGVLHCSILDGWWAEAYNGKNGFAIGRGEDYENTDEQDMIETETLYGLLENTIVPMFYERNSQGIPEQWLARMKNNLQTLAGEFSTIRMVRDYTHKFYLPAMNAFEHMNSENGFASREFHVWKKYIADSWTDVRVASLKMEGMENATVGKRIFVSASIESNEIAYTDLLVQVYSGTVDSHNSITNPQTCDLEYTQSDGSLHYYEGSFVLKQSGTQGATVRVVPTHPMLQTIADGMYSTWAV